MLHYFEFLEPQTFKDEDFTVMDVHALTICDYDGEETMLYYFDDDLEVIQEFEFMIPKQAKEKAAEDFQGIDIQWKNK